MSAGDVEMAPAPAPTPTVGFTDIVRVETQETSGCDGCEPEGPCEDYISRVPIIFPAYKNTGNKKCHNRDTMEQSIKYRGADGYLRDPATRIRFKLPEDLANLNIERAEVVDPDEEEFDWTQWQDDLFPNNRVDSDFEENEEIDGSVMEEEIFDVDHIVRLIAARNPARAAAVYYATKHHVTDFDTKIITTLWEAGLDGCAEDLFAHTVEMAPDWYSYISIAELWFAGMEEQAWQLHILKARWLPNGKYPAGMIIHYVRQHMHRLAASLHDRTISVLYKEAGGAVYEAQKTIDCIVAMSAFGMKDQARELYEHTLKVREHFDWKIILKLKECGMELEAGELFESTYSMTEVHDARGIVELYKAGFKQQAEVLHANTVDNGTWYDLSAIIEMNEIGMRDQAIETHEWTVERAQDYNVDGIIAMVAAGLETQALQFHLETVEFVKAYDSRSIINLYKAGYESLEDAAVELHDSTLSNAKMFAVHDITGLYDAGMTTQAAQLFEETLPHAKIFEGSAMLALLGSGMENEAEEYFKKILPKIHEYNLNGILALADAGYKDYASKIHYASFDEEDFNFTVKYRLYDAVDRIEELREAAMHKEANELKEILDVTFRKYKREGV